MPRVEVGGAYVEFHEGDPGEPERPLLNHLAVLVDSADEHKRDAEELGIEVESVVDAANTLRRLPLGPRPRAHRVRRAQADVLALTLSAASLHIAGAGMAGLVRGRCARASSGVDVVVLREGRPRRRLDAALVVRRLALPRPRRRSARECPGGDEELQRR